jgi:glucosamine 6-phosphate synthetase-like amidotransferase/phosphosugar isomerase protein
MFTIVFTIYIISLILINWYYSKKMTSNKIYKELDLLDEHIKILDEDQAKIKKLSNNLFNDH